MTECRIQPDQNWAQRNDADPDVLEKIPAEIAGGDDFPLAADFCNEAEDLAGLNGPFDLGLGVADDVEAVGGNAADAVHDVLSVSASVENHVALFEGAVGLAEEDMVPLIHQEGGHAVAGDEEAHFFSLLGELDEHRQIFIDVNKFCFHVPDI